MAVFYVLKWPTVQIQSPNCTQSKMPNPDFSPLATKVSYSTVLLWLLKVKSTFEGTMRILYSYSLIGFDKRVTF